MLFEGIYKKGISILWQRKISVFKKFWGGDFYFGPDTMLSCHAPVQIGSGFSVTSDFRLTCLNNIIIDENVLLGSHVTIIDCNHGMDPLKEEYKSQEMLLKEVIIEKGVWCGDNVTILPGVRIGKHSIIGAGSVVAKYIPEYSIAVGNPARVIKKWNFEKNAWEKV